MIGVRMKYSYVLRINCDNSCHNEITCLLNCVPTQSTDNRWEFEIVQNCESDYVDYIKIFFDLLGNKYAQLEQIGITRDLIVIWIYYEYDQQCNMEFLPEDLKKIGSNGISLCVSCWQKEKSGTPPD